MSETEKRYINHGAVRDAKGGYKIVEVDKLGKPLVWYRGYYDGISSFELYPEMIVVPGAVKNVRKSVSVFRIRKKGE